MKLKQNQFNLLIIALIIACFFGICPVYADAKMSDEAKVLVSKMEIAQSSGKLVNTKNIVFKFKMESEDKKNLVL
jgi:hypothetical protein